MWLSLALVLIWTGWAVYFNSAQFGDNIEQFNWAQSLELGYHKHPPMPSWALGALIRCFGPSVFWAYALASACLLGTAGFTWAIGRRLVGERAAAAGLLLWGLCLSFSQRAQLYNHNTVLVLFVSAAAWAAMRATASDRRAFAWWLSTGVFAAGAVLSKYQALVPLAGIATGLLLSGSLRPAAHRRGVVAAIAVMLLLCAPHALWVAQHDFTTLRYASEAVETSTPAQRLLFIASFWANQVRLEFPALLAVALCIAGARHGRPLAAPAASAPMPAHGATVRAWMFGLIGFGLIALVAMALGGGVSLRNHWGVQALQFLGLWIAYRWERWRPIDLRLLACVTVLIHGVSLGLYAVEHQRPEEVLDVRRIDTLYPARRLAQAAVAHWSQTTSCPLHFVAGAGFDSGLVSLYSGGNLVVFDSALATPWVKPEELQREGALYVLEADDAVPPGVTAVIPFDLMRGDRSGRPARSIRIGVLMPQMRCGD